MSEFDDIRARGRNLIKAEAATSDIRGYSFVRLDDEGDDEFTPGLPGFPARDGAPRNSGYGIDQIVSEAEAIMRDAQEEADKLLAETRRKAQQEWDRIHREALETARAELQNQPDPDALPALEELKAATLALKAIAEQVQERWQRQLDQMHDDLFKLGLEIARKVVGREIEQQPEIVVDQVHEALASQGSGELTVRVNPLDMPLIQQALLELQAERSVGDLLSFDEDPSVERGGCLVVGEQGTSNWQPSAKIDKIRREMGV